MQNITGSISQESTGPKLTPFEQADYNLAKFALNAQLSMELDSVVKRLSALEVMKTRMNRLLETSESVTLLFSVKSRLSEIEEEIVAAEFLLQTICAAYGQDI